MQPSNLFVKMALQTWEIQVKRASKLLDSLSDEQLQSRISPNRNRGTYILGHLIAVHDAMLPLLNLGERTHAELDDLFIKNPDNEATTYPSAGDLRSYWTAVNARVADRFATVTPDSWFQRHTAMTDEDLEKDPTRNKLNVVINRAGHLSYHLGQLILLK